MTKRAKVTSRKEGARPKNLKAGAVATTILPRETDTAPLTGGFSATVNGLVVEGAPSFDAWATSLDRLRIIERGAQFAIGDALNYGEDRYGEQASQVIGPETGWSLKTIQVYCWVAKRVPQAVRRMDRLGILHHIHVAALPPAKQKVWLDRAADDDDPWTATRLRYAVTENGDAPVTGWWVVVSATDEGDQLALLGRLEAEGRTCKTTTRRRKNAPAQEGNGQR